MNFAVFLACRKLPLVIGKRLNALCQRPALKSPLLRWDSAERPPPPILGKTLWRVLIRVSSPDSGVLGSLAATTSPWRGRVGLVCPWHAAGAASAAARRGRGPWPAVLIQTPGYLR